MAPPPSQAGRFKPRKPAKKIRTPDAVDSEGDGVPAGGGSGRGGGRFQRGGRGGPDGRGRGRGRFALPQGQVFFTASPAALGSASSSMSGKAVSQAAQRRLASANSAAENHVMGAKAARLKREAADAACSEEIVGTLEEGIGTSAVPSSVFSGSSDFKKPDAAMSAFERALMGDEMGGAGKNVGADADLYDSDTSDEGAGKSFGRQRKQQLKAPISLPFPDTRNHDERRHEESSSRAIYASPFAHPDDKDAIRYEKSNFFLIQLPTRLPPLTMGEIINSEGPNTEAAGEELAAVATPSLQTSGFDNSLSGAVPGRLGKIKVYESGKTVLVFEGPDGQPAVEMKVSEGLTCGFKQLASAIDLNAGVFLPIGYVEKTVVVTPDLSRAASRV